MPPTRLHPFALPLPLRTSHPTRTPLLHHRAASHASQGRANGAAQGPGKRLGAKKGATELVVPGNIIFRQRGTLWYPGENCGMGRDHTIFAKEKGYVVFYRDPEAHKRRKYIGVVFEKHEVLPRKREAPRRRRLGMVGRERVLDEAGVEGEEGLVEVDGLVEAQVTVRQQSKRTKKKVPELELRPGYQYRESNWSIGRAAERANIKVREYKRGDRFLAWRKLNARKARNAEKRALSSRKLKGKSKK